MKLLRFELERFGLTVRDLAGLGDTPVQFHATVDTPAYERVYRYPPHERLARLDALTAPAIGMVLSNWPGKELPAFDAHGVDRFIAATLPARDLPKLGRLPIARVSIWRVGRRRPRVERNPTPKLFCVKSRYAVQIEGQRRGMQTVEERFVLVRAPTHHAAQQIVREDAPLSALVMLNSDGLRFRYMLEEVIGSFETWVEELGDPIFEIWSEFHQRRLPKASVWLP